MKSELQKLKAEIEDNYKADLAAVNQLLTIYSEKRQEASKKLGRFIDASRPKKRASEIIEELIKNQTGEFSTNTIYFKLRDSLMKNPTRDHARQISQVINKLRQRNPREIEEVKKGAGSRSGTYKYIKP